MHPLQRRRLARARAQAKAAEELSAANETLLEKAKKAVTKKKSSKKSDK